MIPEIPPALDEQLAFWAAYDWSHGGEEWSESWGGTAALYAKMLRPRLASYLPATCLLEIATGYGRITAHLLEDCATLIGVDLVPACVEACRRRFAGRAATFFVCDGVSLPMVETHSVDLAVSWDSLVHSPPAVLERYAHEFARVLAPGGAALVHHSNLGSVSHRYAPTTPRHGRDPEMTADTMAAYARSAGLSTRAWIIDWGGAANLDALTLLVADR